MDQVQVEFELNEIRKEIKEIKNKAEKGERIKEGEYSELHGQIYMLWRLKIIAMKEWQAMCDDIGFAYCGIKREGQI
ncbi:hypothetical protein [Eubacterium sp.]|uniref:hypothetical protein n=1 Tax=Eubacterium sp. TaxID=142586 RepID=UPI0026DF23E9|nr:hypothetical protein [Eubacterium sp.]MDO5433352.1 hypothetical protein [Eubacterium sp.]